MVTTSTEREHIRKNERYGKPVLIENHPPATREEVKLRPREIDELKWIDGLEMFDGIFDDK